MLNNIGLIPAAEEVGLIEQYTGIPDTTVIIAGVVVIVIIIAAFILKGFFAELKKK